MMIIIENIITILLFCFACFFVAEVFT